jgi:Concanavalin A-like lectin/glucanases superfamily
MIPAVYPPIWASGASGGDPFFSDVVNLSHFDGTNGSTTFVDDSSHHINLNAQGTAALSTAQFQFGTASLRCPFGFGVIGANAISSAIYSIGKSDFVIEFWVNPDSLSASQNILFFDDGQSSGFYFFTTGKISVYLQSVDRIISTARLSAGTWTYCAYSRIGVTGSFYMGNSGTAALQGTYGDNFNYGNFMYLGNAGVANNELVGYIDDFRWTIGSGRGYSGATIHVPTAPFPNS